MKVRIKVSSVAERIRVVAFETVKLRDQEGVGSIPGPDQVGGVFILVETHKVSLLKSLKKITVSPDGWWGRQAELPITNAVVK